MASYTSPDISGYNSNPPSDDGTETTANRIDWATIKNKLNDPTKTYSEAIDSATTSAFTTVDGQIADGSAWYAADTGAADAYVVTLSPAVSGNVVGRKTSFKATNTNTGASTLNLNAIGAESIKRYDGDALLIGDIVATRTYTVIWDGTNYVLQNQISSGQTWATSATTKTWASDTTYADVTGDLTLIENETYEVKGMLEVTAYGGGSVKIQFDPSGVTILHYGCIFAGRSSSEATDNTVDTMTTAAPVITTTETGPGAIEFYGFLKLTSGTSLTLQAAQLVSNASALTIVNTFITATRVS